MGLIGSLGGVFDGFLLATLHASAMVAAVWLIRRVFGHRIPASAYGFAWCLVFVRLALPISVATPVSVYQLFESPLSSEVATPTLAGPALEPGHVVLTLETGEKPLVNESQPAAVTVAGVPSSGHTAEATVSWVFWLWLVGLGTIGCLLVRHGFRTFRIVRLSRRINDGRLKHLLYQCVEKMGVRRIPDLHTCECVGEPILTGTFRPMLLLPEEMATELSDEELRDVFCHELAHLKRRDVALACFTSSVVALHWFNPFVWVALRALQQDRELAADAYVLRVLGKERSGRDYGRTLLRVLEIQPTRPPVLQGAVPFAGGVGVMKRRIQAMIAGHKERKAITYLAVLLFAGFACIAMSEPPEDEPNGGQFVAQTDIETPTPDEDPAVVGSEPVVCSMLDELATIRTASDETHPWPDTWQEYDPVWLESLSLTSAGAAIRGLGQTGYDVAEFLMRLESGSSEGVVFWHPQITMIRDMEHPVLGPVQDFEISGRPPEWETRDVPQVAPELGDVQLWLADLLTLPQQNALDLYNVRMHATHDQQGRYELELSGTMSGMRRFCRDAHELSGTAEVAEIHWWARDYEPEQAGPNQPGVATFLIVTDRIVD